MTRRHSSSSSPSSLLALSIVTLAAAGTATAAEFKAGEWDLSLGGQVNGELSVTHCNAAAKAKLCDGVSTKTDLDTGAITNTLTTKAKSVQNGLTIGGALTVAGGSSSGDDSWENGVAVRQASLSVGNASMGTLRLGRDAGLFGANAALNSTLLRDAGYSPDAILAATDNVFIGANGPGSYGQLSYQSANFGGFSLSAGLFQGTSATLQADDDSPASTYGAGSIPQVQLMAKFEMDPMLTAWGGMKYQKFEARTEGVEDYTMSGFELGANVDFGMVSALANFQTGKALGLEKDGDQGDTKDQRLLLEGVFKLGTDWKIGAGYQRSVAKFADGKLTGDAFGGVAHYRLTKGLTSSFGFDALKIKTEPSQKVTRVYAGAVMAF